jgi:nitrogen-specific signal transduction histidine kinase
MDKNNKNIKETPPSVGGDFINHFWEKSWTYIKTTVDIMRESVLILDKNFNVMAANESFYKTFQVGPNNTEGVNIYNLGSGQWNIPSLKKLLEDILPKKTFFKGFQVAQEFPSLGRRVMILNARQIYVEESNPFPPIILLAIEDVTEMMNVAEVLANHAKNTEDQLSKKTTELKMCIEKLSQEIKKPSDDSVSL